MTTLNPNDHPVSTRLLMTDPTWGMLAEAVVLEWTIGGNVKLHWPLSGCDTWFNAGRIANHPIVELLPVHASP